jgi:hypothetical protein
MLSNFPDLEETILETPSENLDSPMSNNIEETNRKERSHSPVPVIDNNNENEGDADDEEDGDGSVYDSEDDEIEDDDELDYDDELDDGEEAVVFEVATAQAPTRVAMVGTQVVQAKGAVVNIPRRVPPPLPIRSPARTSRRRSQMPDFGNVLNSPLRQESDLVETSGVATPVPKILGSASGAAEAKDLESPANSVQTFRNSGVTLAPEFEERSSRRASAIVQSATSTEEQANLSKAHRATVSVA